MRLGHRIKKKEVPLTIWRKGKISRVVFNRNRCGCNPFRKKKKKLYKYNIRDRGMALNTKNEKTWESFEKPKLRMASWLRLSSNSHPNMVCYVDNLKKDTVLGTLCYLWERLTQVSESGNRGPKKGGFVSLKWTHHFIYIYIYIYIYTATDTYSGWHISTLWPVTTVL